MNTATNLIEPTRAAESALVIRDSVSLESWRQQLRKLTPTRNLPYVLFQLPELSREQNQTISALAWGYQKECGCTSGSFFTSVAVAATVLSHFLSGNSLAEISLRHLVSLLGIAVLAALCGKLVSLLWARWRLLGLANHTYNVIASPRGSAAF